MNIEAYLICWNEIDIMPLVVKHYQRFCSKITIMDNHSTDGSVKLAKKLGCEVIPFGTMFFDDHENRNVKNNIWKGSKADLVLIADFDEILFDNRSAGLSYCNFICDPSREFTIFKTYGWQVMSEDMPKDDLLEITNGYHFKNYSKSILFNPQAITEIKYDFGAHECKPEGDVRWSTDELYLLHYKHIGGVQRTIDRYAQYQNRMSKNNRKFAHGIHYNRSVPSLKQEWAERMAKSHPLI